MVRSARYPTALALLLVLAGCGGGLPGVGTETAGPVEPQLAGTTSTGGQCVDAPMLGMVVESHREEDRRVVTVAGNVTVPGAHYEVDDIVLHRVDERTVRLDVTTRASEQKPARECPDGGVVHYQATVELPPDGYALQIAHDGTVVSTVGSGPES